MSAAISGVRDERIMGAVVALVMLGALAVANFAGAEGENGGPVEFAVTGVVALGVAALVFGRVIPRARDGARAGRTALVLAVLGVLTLAVFWSGLPQVLAPAAVVLGLAAPRSGESVAAVTLGSLAYVASLVGVFIG